MPTYRDLTQWGDRHHPRWFVILRIALGFVFSPEESHSCRTNNALLKEMIVAAVHWAMTRVGCPILVTWMNLLGGLFLVLGIQTRLVAILELPMVIGAIVIINVQKTLFAPQSELGLAFLALLLLVFFIVEGGGPLSLDNYFYKNRSRDSRGTSLP